MHQVQAVIDSDYEFNDRSHYQEILFYDYSFAKR